MANPEVHTGSVEKSEVEKAAAERSKELLEQAERKHEHHETDAEHDARATAEKEAKSAEEYRPHDHQEHEKEAAPIFSGEHSRDKSFKETMHSVERDLSPPERVFSKIIHNKTVEAVSDTVGSTVARPNAILSGSICAFVLVLAVYLTARHFGFALSGFETIAAFVVGWVIGIVFDFLRVMISGKR